MLDAHCSPYEKVKKAAPKVVPRPKPQPKPKVVAPNLPKGVQINYNQLTLMNKGWKVCSSR